VPENLREGKYRIDFFYLERGKDSPERFSSADYIIKKKTIEALVKGIACIPLNKQCDRIRGE